MRANLDDTLLVTPGYVLNHQYGGLTRTYTIDSPEKKSHSVLASESIVDPTNCKVQGVYGKTLSYPI